MPWSAAGALPRREPARKQTRTRIDVTSSPPGTRDAKNQGCQESGPPRAEPAGTVQPSPTIRSRNQRAAVRSCQEPSPTVRTTVLPSFFIGNQCGRSLKQTSQIQLAYWRIAARDLQPSISRSSLLHHRARRNPQSTQARPTTPLWGAGWVPKGGHLPELPSQNVGHSQRRQRRPSPRR